MYHSILVPLDGSPFAEQALPLALTIANRAGASLEVVRVHELYALKDPHCCWSPFDPAEDAMFKEQEQAYLDGITKRLGKAASVPVTSALVNGRIEDGILERARAKPADLIVMTTHGCGATSRFWLGSVADELVRHAPVPVLMMRPREASQDLEPEPTLRRMLIPLDGSEFAKQVREPAIALGSLMDSEYVLVRAVESSSLPVGFPVAAELRVAEQSRLEKRKAEAQAYLDRVAERLRAEAFRIETHVVVGESAAAAVLDVTRDKGIDVIAIATHGRSGLKRLFLGSVADKILRGTCLPVLVTGSVRW
ncbi:MAG: universal stress protein [Thermoguttaceae bacterium]|jgi:nucleotide-binding universal stress UspA family protein